MLSKCTVNTLNHIAILCGFHIPHATKAARLAAIQQGMEYASSIPPKVDVLSVDIGIKNFSYCRINNVDLDKPPGYAHPAGSWSKIDLDHAFGSAYKPLIGHDDPIDKRRYLSHITRDIVDACVAEKAPTVVAFESQRTSNAGGGGSSGMLPTVLLNYTFESVFCAYWHLKHPQTLVWPIPATRMASFWINRFFCKDSVKRARKNAKHLRQHLVFGLAQRGLLIKSPALEGGFEGMSAAEVARTVMSRLNLEDSRVKLDDLVDSALYGLTTIQYLKNQRLLRGYLESGRDPADFVRERSAFYVDLVGEVGEEFGLRWNGEYVH